MDSGAPARLSCDFIIPRCREEINNRFVGGLLNRELHSNTAACIFRCFLQIMHKNSLDIAQILC